MLFNEKYSRHYRYEQKLACLLWKIDIRDVIIIPTETTESANKNKNMVNIHFINISPSYLR